MYKRSFKKLPLIRILAVILISAAIFLGYKYSQFQYLVTTPLNSQSIEEQIFTVKKGDSVKVIAENLVKQQLLLDAESFNLYARLNNLDKQIKTGRFPLSPNLNTPQILAVLSSNQVRQAIVTIPEGSTIPEIDQILSNLNLITSGEFIKTTKDFANYAKYPFLNASKQKALPHPLEGYLFPDTYYVSALEFSTENFLSVLLNTFSKKALPITEKSSRPIEELINIAAMIEKEANRDQDRPIIAGIIWKRLDEKWALGIDATLLYLKNDRTIDSQDLQEKSAYNTRINAGLPPGPIANPGLASIKAAAEPKDSKYYFYLTSRDGEMIYATTNEEHNQNKAKYL